MEFPSFLSPPSPSPFSLCAVSYTHLDVYKRQVKVEAKIDTKKYNEEIESGRIDIILEQEKPSKKAILIENKVYAKNQEKQLERYYEYCLKEYVSPENFRIIYLTQFGDEYITKNLHLKENVYEISYKKEIVMWLKMCYNCLLYTSRCV